jgi:RNA polymerase sigma-70 factor (ECF subfamily)
MSKVRPWLANNAITTRYTLLDRLKNREDQESWQDFFETYWRLIYSFAIQSGLTEMEAQEVVQETVIYVAKCIHTFKHERAMGSFKGWLRNIARWRVVDQLRKRAQDVAEEVPYNLENIPDPAGVDVESIWESEWRANLFDVAMERVKGRVKDEYYQIFDLSVVKQLSPTKIARTLDISMAQVYLAKHRVSALIKKEIQLLEQKQL